MDWEAHAYTIITLLGLVFGAILGTSLVLGVYYLWGLSGIGILAGLGFGGFIYWIMYLIYAIR